MFWARMRKLTFERLFGDGQLYFFCAALAASVLGDIPDYLVALRSASRKADEIERLQDAAGFAHDNFIIVIVVFAVAYGATLIASPLRRNALAWGSLFFGISTSMVVGWCRYYLGMW